MNKTYSQIYNERIHSDYFQDLDGIYKHLENPTKKNLDKLVSCVESTGAHGWFGLSAEISDILSSSGRLDNYPVLKIRLEIERLKRLQYLGFIAPVTKAKDNVISLLNEHKAELDKNDRLLWEMQAYGQLAWVVFDKRKLTDLIKRCNKLLGSYTGTFTRLNEAFNIALQGRLNFLANKPRAGEKCFKEAMSALEAQNLLRPLAHVQMYFAEHLFQYGDKDSALSLAKNFLETRTKSQFKSHLILKALRIILQKHGGEKENDKLLQYYLFRYNILVYAMGLSQSHRLYPILSEISDIIPDKYKIDFYHFDARVELKKRLQALNWKEFEAFIKRYHELLDYNVIDLPECKRPLFKIG